MQIVGDNLHELSKLVFWKKKKKKKKHERYSKMLCVDILPRELSTKKYRNFHK